ncbi:MAG: ABC transporter ATP-binding protein/permease [Nitrospirota bacterium]|nr:ABC transporter ATP-binding protein/permease [Nitrospirota bacterium]MDH5699511.1 ABC transporter ATP-binding protein/permease [Nitrospirota bacterium]
MNDRSPNPVRQIVVSHLLRMKGKVLIAGLSLLGIILTEVLIPWPLKIIFDYILLDKPLPEFLSMLAPLLQAGTSVALIVLSCSMAGIALLNGSFSYFQTYTTARIGHELVYILRRELFSHLQQLPLSFHTRSRTGELLSRVSDDTSILKDVFAEWSLTLLANLLTILSMMAIMFWLNWQLSLVVLANVPILFFCLYILNKKIKVIANRQRNQEGKMATQVSEVLSSMTLVQAFGREEHEDDLFEVQSAKNREEGIRTARTTAAVSKIVILISAIGKAATVLFGAFYVLSNAMTPGDLLIFVSYVTSLFKPLRQMARLSAKFSRAFVSAKRISDILSIRPNIVDPPNAIAAVNLRGDIKFQDVSFGYNPQSPVLHDISFHILPGQRVAMVGASGAGKSTTINLLLRLYEAQAGTILIDGRDIKEYSRESLRREIGIVLQDTVLTGASIRENISYGKPNATVEEVEDAARKALAHDFIMELPDHYDTILGERGGTLSGGQRQRICLARAIIKRPSLLILDEPTSAVDPISKALIRETVQRIQQGKTTLFIAHEFCDMEQFDHILVFKNGRIVEHGPHRELVKLQGHYCELVNA